MSLWTFLRQHLRAYRRVPFFGRRALSLLLGGFLALYLGGGLVLLGVVFDDLVREVAPSADPLLVASRGLLPFALVYGAVRVIVESGVGTDLRPYLPLPLRRSALVGVTTVLALLSLWNAVPMAFVVTVCAEAALDGALGPALRFGLVSAGVLAAVTYAVPMLRRAVSERPFVAVGIIVLLGVVTALEAVDVGAGLVSLLDVSGWLLGGAVQGRVLPVSGAVLGLVGLAGGYVRCLRRAMVVDCSQRRSASGGSSEWLSRLARRGPAWREAVLETRLLLRNSQARFLIFIVVFFVGMTAVMGLLPIEWSVFRDVPPLERFNLIVFPGLFGTGGFIIWHGQNLFSWRGSSCEGSMVRPEVPRHRMGGKVLFLSTSALVCFLLPLPVLLWTRSPFLTVHTSFFLYNAGVLAPAIVAGATFNRKALATNEFSFSNTNFSGGRMAFMLPLFGLPVFPILLFGNPIFQFGPIAGLGLVSACAWPLWRRAFVALYRRNRYAMMRGFRASRS